MGHPSQVSSLVPRDGPGGNSVPFLGFLQGLIPLMAPAAWQLPLRILGQREGIFMYIINSGLERANLSPIHSSCTSSTLPFFNLKDPAGSHNGGFGVV